MLYGFRNENFLQLTYNSWYVKSGTNFTNLGRSRKGAPDFSVWPIRSGEISVATFLYMNNWLHLFI